MIARPVHLMAFLNDLREANIGYRLSHHRDEAIMVEVAVPGERWEIEFLENGRVEAEVFRSDSHIVDAGILDDLIRRHHD